MGSGTWTRDAFTTYSTTIKGMSVDSTGSISGSYSNQEMFKSRGLDPALDPKNAIRECCDTDEHPNTIPVILALDVTGSMGQTAVEVAKKLNVIMTKLYEEVTDVEFMIMGIGDLSCDSVPIQASQFESDIRIAEQLDKIYFEFGGGGNNYESYTAAWYFGSRHTNLDCLKRDKRGIIITMGDEQLNPYLPINGRNCGLAKATGDNLQADIETKDLYEETVKKFDIYHLDVNHGRRYDESSIEMSFKKYLDDNHFRKVTMDSIVNEIVDIIVSASKDKSVHDNVAQVDSNGAIAW